MPLPSRFALPSVLALSLVLGGESASLRHRGPAAPAGNVPDMHHNASIMALHHEISFDVVEKSSISSAATAKCLCNVGQFWHWRINKCISQGAWGYECGFFPAEHHRVACKDGLKCERLHSSELKGAAYLNHVGAKPASCTRCTTDDHCSQGQERHETQCLKEYDMYGEACATVRVNVRSRAVAKASGTHAASKSTAEAEAVRPGEAHARACVPVLQVKKNLHLADVPKVGPVLAAEVISAGDKEAFDLAYDKALASAQSAGRISAEQAAKELAKEKALVVARLTDESKVRNATAWKLEAGRNIATQAAAGDKA